MNGLSVTFLCDYAAEGWPSMDLVGHCLPEALERAGVRVERHQPRARRWFGPVGPDGWTPRIGERLINRYVFYPRSIPRASNGASVFHVVDHSYAHVVHHLPASRTVVTCHDLDAFACVLDPAQAPRPWWFRKAVLRTLRGLQRAGTIACVSETVRNELTRTGLVDPQRLVVVPNGIHPAFTAAADASDDREAVRLLGLRGSDSGVELLHVGIPIARKRLDVALQVLARLRSTQVPARLVRVGGALPREWRLLAKQLGVADRVIELPFLSPGVLAAVFRRASVLLVPSDREGFALPIVEALACGTPVVANDIPALRETGGCEVSYRGNDDLDGWCAEVGAILSRGAEDAKRWQDAARARAGRYTWRAAADRLGPVYRELSSR